MVMYKYVYIIYIYECVLLAAHLCTNTMAKRDYNDAYSFKSSHVL